MLMTRVCPSVEKEAMLRGCGGHSSGVHESVHRRKSPPPLDVRNVPRYTPPPENYFPRTSECDPVRWSERTRTLSTLRYTSTQSGRMWHSRNPIMSPFRGWSRKHGSSSSPSARARTTASSSSCGNPRRMQARRSLRKRLVSLTVYFTSAASEAIQDGCGHRAQFRRKRAGALRRALPAWPLATWNAAAWPAFEVRKLCFVAWPGCSLSLPLPRILPNSRRLVNPF